MTLNEKSNIEYIADILYYKEFAIIWGIGKLICKNRDEQLTFIVRVSLRYFFNY